MLRLPEVDAIVHILPVSDVLVAICSTPGSRVQHREGGFHAHSYPVVRRLNYAEGQTVG